VVCLLLQEDRKTFTPEGPAEPNVYVRRENEEEQASAHEEEEASEQEACDSNRGGLEEGVVVCSKEEEALAELKLSCICIVGV